MPIVNLGQIQAVSLERTRSDDPDQSGINQVLTIAKSGSAVRMATRHISDGAVGWTKPNALQDFLVLTVSGRSQRPVDVFVGERAFRRPQTQPGAVVISNFRESGYADLRGVQIDNTSINVPWDALDALADDLRVPKVTSIKSFLEEDRVDATILYLVGIVNSALERPQEANQLFLEHVFGAVTAHIAFNYGAMEKPRALMRGSLTSLQERRVKSLLLDRLAEPPSLQELASSCSLSQSHFSRAFKEATGLPPHQWLLVERVKRAKSLLRETPTPIGEIALECGFADQSHLTKVFTKALSVSPAAWRRAGRC